MGQMLFETDELGIMLDDDVLEVVTLADGGHADCGESGESRWGARVDCE